MSFESYCINKSWDFLTVNLYCNQDDAPEPPQGAQTPHKDHLNFDD